MAVRFTLRRQSNTAEERAVLEQLGNVLAGLPAPWSVIVNERPRQPPWVRYLAFHPDKGLALLDVASSRPESKVGRVTSLFTRAGFGAFEQGSLPLIAIGIGKFQIEALEFCLDTAFQSVRCGLTIADWPEQAIALLLERSDMNLKRLGRTNPSIQTPAAAVATPPIVTDTPEAAIEEPVPTHAAPPDPIPVHATPPDPAPVHAVPPEPVPEIPPMHVKKVRPDLPPLRLQAEPRRGARAQYDLPRAKPRRRIRGMAAVAAGAAVVAYAYFVMPLPAPKNAPPAATQPRSTPQVAAAPTSVPKPNNTAAPENKSVEATAKPPSMPTDMQPIAKADNPAPANVTPPVNAPAVPAPAGTSVENLPPPQLNATPLVPPPRNAQPAQNAQPEQLAVIPTPPPPPPPKPRIEHHAAHAQGDTSPEPDQDLVIVNGQTYVYGRQPHSLGTVTMPADRTDAWNSSASEWNVLVAPSVQAQP